MKTIKNRGFFRKAWPCLCLILSLSACSVQQRTSAEQGNYRVVLILPPGFGDNELAAALTAVPAGQVDFKPYYGGLDIAGKRMAERTVMLTVGSGKALQDLREQLQASGVVVQMISVLKE